MKKLISLLACAALLVGLVIAVFPAVTGTADTTITTPGFTDEAPGTTTFKLGGANGATSSGGVNQATVTIGEDKTYTYNLTQALGYWVSNQVYAPDNKTAADITGFKYLYVNVVNLENGYCTNANGEYVDTSGKVVATEKEAKYQAGFLAKLVLVDANGNRLTKDGADWSIIGDVRSVNCVRVDLDDLKTQLQAKGLNANTLLGNLQLAALVYGTKVEMELYASNNEAFDPKEPTASTNATLSLEMSASSGKGTIAKNEEGYYVVTPASDKIALANMFAESGAGNVNATTYPYLHMKFTVPSGAKVTSAVLVDVEGNVYKKNGADVNVLGGTVERSKQIAFELAGMTEADKEQFLSNLRVKFTIEGGSVNVIAKLSTKEDLKISSDNVPGVTAFKLTAKPGANMPANATVVTDEETGSTKYQLGGHLAAWVPADLYIGAKEVNANEYRYLFANVISMTDGLCRNDTNTAYAKEVKNPDGSTTWVDADGEADAKVQTGFIASFQLSYKNSSGTQVQLKKVNLDSSGALKLKSIREDSKELATTKYDKKSAFTSEVTVDGQKKNMTFYYVLDDNGKYMVDASDWGVMGEARQPLCQRVDFDKIDEQIKESNAALDRALKDGKISQAERDTYYMDLTTVRNKLTVRALVYGAEVQVDYYVTNNGSFEPGDIDPIADEEKYGSVQMGVSRSQEYTANPAKFDAYYYLKTDSNYIENPAGGNATVVANLYALQGAGNMDARKYKYMFLRVNTLENGTKISSMKFMDMEGNVLDQNLLNGDAVAGKTIRIDLTPLSDEQREQFLENTRLQIVMNGTRANIQAAFSVNEGYAFEAYLDESDPNYAYKLHLTPLHIEFNSNDVTFRTDGSVSVNLSANGAGMHVMDRNGAIDATEYKYMYIYLESGAINDIRFRTSDNASDDDLKVQATYSASPGLTRINLEELNKSKPRLMKDLCFNLVVYVNTEITGIWFSNSPTFDPIAMASESDYEIVIGQRVAPISSNVSMQMNLDGSMDFGGKGEAHFKPITGTKGFNASSVKYLVVDVASGAENLTELRLRDKDNELAKSVSGLQDGLNYLVINKLDEKILENIYFTMVVNGNVSIRSMWFTNEPGLNPNYKALEPDYEEIDLSLATPYLPQEDRETSTSASVLTVDANGLVTVSGPMNRDVGLYTTCYYDDYSNPAQSLYIKFGVVNRPTYVVAYTYDTVSTESQALVDVLTVDIEPGTYNDYVRIDLRDSSFFSKGFNGFLEINIYSPAQNGSGNGVAFTVDSMMYQGTACPALTRLAKSSTDEFVPVDGALYLQFDASKWGDWNVLKPDDGGAETGENSATLPAVVLVVTGATAMAAMAVVYRRKRQKA